jgi:hypothetical protein
VRVPQRKPSRHRQGHSKLRSLPRDNLRQALRPRPLDRHQSRRGVRPGVRGWERERRRRCLRVGKRERQQKAECSTWITTRAQLTGSHPRYRPFRRQRRVILMLQQPALPFPRRKRPPLPLSTQGRGTRNPPRGITVPRTPPYCLRERLQVASRPRREALQQPMHSAHRM